MRRIGPAVFAVGALVLVLSLTGGEFTAPARAQETLNVGVGVGSGTVSGNVYTPSEFTVHVGDSVQWTINSDEPHSITFGSFDDPSVPPDQWPVSGWEAPEGGENPFAPVDLGTAEYDGTSFTNTGVIGGGSTAGLTFTSEGSFPFVCVIHPGMSGVVNVVPDSEPKTTQEEADAAAADQADLILGEVDSTRQSTLDNIATSEERDDGTTLWTISTEGLLEELPEGSGPGYLELLEFIPDELTIEPGDTVRWEARAVHTVSFLSEDQDPTMLDPFGTPPEKPSDDYDGESFYNSGLFNAGPDAPTSFELTFPDPGTYAYLCLLHWPLGQTGTITVEGGDAVELPDTGTGPSGSSFAWIAGGFGLLAAGLALSFGGLVLRAAARR